MTRFGGARGLFPWGVGRGVGASFVTVASGFGLVFVRYRVADQPNLQEQVPWLTAAIALLMLALGALCSLVFGGRRAVGQRRAALIGDAVAELYHFVVASPDDRIDATGADRGLVWIAGLHLVHRSDCSMIEGRSTLAFADSGSVGEDLEACGICLGIRSPTAVPQASEAS